MTKKHSLFGSNGMKLTIDQIGGRISEVSVRNQNALVEKGIQTGSTFWPSPQSLWDWPPPKSIDMQSYQLIDISKKHVHLRSEPCDSLGIIVEKCVESLGEYFKIVYSIHNNSENPINVAPWEISRVKSGVAFFESDSNELDISTGTTDKLTSHALTSIHRYCHNPESQQTSEKIFINNSAGWLAHVYDGLLLIKRFPQVALSDIAPNEAEIEIYAGAGNKENAYMELEQQGAYLLLAPDDFLEWEVEWHIAPTQHTDIIVNGEVNQALLDQVFMHLGETSKQEALLIDAYDE